MRPHPLNRRWTCRGAALAAAAALTASVGCHHRRPPPQATDDGPPPVKVVTNYAPNGPAKPLPPQDGSGGPPPAVVDPPDVRQPVREEPRFLRAYATVNRPKLVVFVNRTATGELLPANPSAAAPPGSAATDDRSAPYLSAGQYDQAQFANIDYQLIETLLTEDLSADGQVTLVAPLAARQRLGEDDVRDVEAGRPQMLGEMVAKLNADVLVQLTARPTQQTNQGLGIRLVAEALNTHGGQAIAFASVDVPPPLTRAVLNEYVRFTARKLMDGMSGSWESMPAAPPGSAPLQNPPPTAPPAATPPPPVNPLSAPPTPAANPLSTPPVVVPTTPTNPLSPTTQQAKPGVNPLDLPPPP